MISTDNYCPVGKGVKDLAPPRTRSSVEEINQPPPHLPGRPHPQWEVADTHLTSLNSITERNTESPSSKGTHKRGLQGATYPREKRQKTVSISSLSESEQEFEVGVEFDPAELVKRKEGTLPVPKPISSYLSKHVKRCLSKEEREALFKEHPRPDLDVCLVPKVDKYMSEFLGKNFPKERETESTRIQAAILAILRPLTAAWCDLLEAGVKEDPGIAVPATEVLSLIQRTICLVGNASELTSQLRREKILGAIDQSWTKFSSEEFPGARNTLFGAEFQTKLTGMVEKDTALAKAVAVTKRHKREVNQSSTRRLGQRAFHFFRRSPPVRYGDRRGKNFHPYSPFTGHIRDASRPPNQHYNRNQYHQGIRPGHKPLFHEPSLPSPQTGQKTQQRKF